MPGTDVHLCPFHFHGKANNSDVRSQSVFCEASAICLVAARRSSGLCPEFGLGVCEQTGARVRFETLDLFRSATLADHQNTVNNRHTPLIRFLL